MSDYFSATHRGGARATFAAMEAALIVNLVAQVVELLRSEAAGNTAVGEDPLSNLVGAQGPMNPPDDPVLARLLPDAYRDDEESAAEFRRFTEPGLRDGKVHNAQRVIDTLREGGLDLDRLSEATDQPVEVELDADDVQAWLRTLTDVRLALATRLGVRDDDQDWWDQLAQDDPRVPMHDVYDWLGYVQETLVRAIW